MNILVPIAVFVMAFAVGFWAATHTPYRLNPFVRQSYPLAPSLRRKLSRRDEHDC